MERTERLFCPYADKKHPTCPFYKHWKNQEENRDYNGSDIIRFHDGKYFCLAFEGLSHGEHYDELDKRIIKGLKSSGLEFSKCVFVESANNQHKILEKLEKLVDKIMSP